MTVAALTPMMREDFQRHGFVVEVPAGAGAYHHGVRFHLAQPHTTGTVPRVHTAIHFADGSTRGEGRHPHPSFERAGIDVGAQIANAVALRCH
jgi:hypothetical protein